MSEMWIDVRHVLVPSVSVGIVAFVILIVFAPSRIWREQKTEIQQLTEREASPLRIIYDESENRFNEDNGKCSMFRITVKNTGGSTIENVELAISAIECRTRRLTEEMQKFVGLRLAVSENPSGPPHAFRSEPDSTARLHMGDPVVFDFVRLCRTRGKGKSRNYSLWHSKHFVDVKHTSDRREIRRIESEPRQTIPSGKYKVTLSTKGDNLAPVTQVFEFWTTVRAIVFRPIGNE